MRRLRRPRDIGGAIDLVRKLPTYARLVWGLLRDPRVPAAQKLILAGIAGYLVLPLDLIPDFIPLMGQIDDLAVVLLGLDLFIRSAPQDVVEEHLARITRNSDDFTRDTEAAQRLLGDRFTAIRGNLERILTRQRARFDDPARAGDALEAWDKRQDKGGDHDGRP